MEVIYAILEFRGASMEEVERVTELQTKWIEIYRNVIIKENLKLKKAKKIDLDAEIKRGRENTNL